MDWGRIRFLADLLALNTGKLGVYHNVVGGLGAIGLLLTPDKFELARHRLLLKTPQVVVADSLGGLVEACDGVHQPATTACLRAHPHFITYPQGVFPCVSLVPVVQGVESSRVDTCLPGGLSVPGVPHDHRGVWR